MSKWLLSISLLALGGAMGVTWVGPIVTKSDKAAHIQRATLLRLSRGLSEVEKELRLSDGIESCMDEERIQRDILQARVNELAAELEGTRHQLATQSLELAEVEQRQGSWVRENLGQRFADLNQDLESRWNDVSSTLSATARIAAMNKDSYDHLLSATDRPEPEPRNIEAMWSHLMGPTVQISDDSTVGSGVLLKSVEHSPEQFRTHLLTAWHVVRDIIHDATDPEELIQIFVYDPSGSRRREWATLVDYDVRLDSALLLMKSKQAFAHGAILPTRSQLKNQSVFATIYAVGCPLGNDPIPTFGEIADTHHEVDGNHYWMINAPTYIGNSGGGIFSSSDHELLGIFSKIYTHGNLRPTVIPHMGLVTPLTAVYDWLEEVGQDHVIPK
jgi:hypothetical protein